MFGYRTPPKKSKELDTQKPPELTTEAGPSHKPPSTSKVRKSIGEWEIRKMDTQSKALDTTEMVPTALAEPLQPIKKTLPSQESQTVCIISADAVEGPPRLEKPKYANREAEAHAYMKDALKQLEISRNLKTEIKIDVKKAVVRLYELVKEAEAGKGKEEIPHSQQRLVNEQIKKTGKEESELMKKLEEHAKLIQENTEKMEKLKETIEKQQETQERLSYASVTAAPVRRQPQEQAALHSIVVTANDDQETGEDVLNRIRKAVNAKEGGIDVERVRKAKDRKVIVSCRTEEGREKVKERLKQAENHLSVQEIKNKDPLVILKDVHTYNSDEDIIKALKKQNPRVFENVQDNEKIEIAFKKRTRNPHTQHIVMRVSPKVWQHLIRAETVKIDLQHVRVADQSPLVQCSLCLGYGHGRRFCKGTVEKCSHCGGPHMKAECTEWIADVPPSCCNCKLAKLDRVDHNAFSNECVIRRKWETIARSTVAYQC